MRPEYVLGEIEIIVEKKAISLELFDPLPYNPEF